jgi:hypothetical protein
VVKTLGLSTPLPNLTQEECYQLLHIGRVMRVPPSHYTITGYFQPWQKEPFLQSLALPEARQIDICRTESLIPGSLWTATGTQLVKRNPLITEHRVWFAGAQAFRIAQLHELLDLDKLLPSPFWASQGETWVAVVDRGSERLLIPCFELLRAFYYHAGERLIRYYFSQLPLDLLCYPKLVPTRSTDYRAQFYVASTYLTDLESLVLGGMLFDSVFQRTLNRAQAHWINPRTGQVPALYAKTTGQLDRNILLQAHGQSFIYDQHPHFWVTSLTPLTSPHGFRRLLYHPLESRVFPSSESKHLPICSDLLNYEQSNPRLIRPQYPPLETSFSQGHMHAGPARIMTAVPIPHPLVAQGATWAREPTAIDPLVWFPALSPTVQTTSSSLAQEDQIQRNAPLFADLLQGFTALEYRVEMLTLNNEFGHFGLNVSVFSHRGFVPLLDKAYRHRVRIFYLAKIELGNGLLFLLYSLHAPGRVLICQKQDLSTPTDAEWQQLMAIAATTKPVITGSRLAHLNARFASIGRQHALRTGMALVVRAVPITKASIALCLNFTEHTLTCFRRRLAVQVGLQTNYPDGISTEHGQRLARMMTKEEMFLPTTLEWTTQVRKLWEQYIRS